MRLSRLSHAVKVTLVRGGKKSMAKDAAQAGAVNRANVQHYRWGTDCDGWHLVKDEQLSVIEELMLPGAAEIRHHHRRAQQFFYILSGEVAMEVEGQTTRVPAGSGIRVLPGKQHQIRNPRRARRGFW